MLLARILDQHVAPVAVLRHEALGASPSHLACHMALMVHDDPHPRPLAPGLVPAFKVNSRSLHCTGSAMTCLLRDNNAERVRTSRGTGTSPARGSQRRRLSHWSRAVVVWPGTRARSKGLPDAFAPPPRTARRARSRRARRPHSSGPLRPRRVHAGLRLQPGRRVLPLRPRRLPRARRGVGGRASARRLSTHASKMRA